jgi:hypothetical protein
VTADDRIRKPREQTSGCDLANIGLREFTRDGAVIALVNVRNAEAEVTSDASYVVLDNDFAIIAQADVGSTPA